MGTCCQLRLALAGGSREWTRRQRLMLLAFIALALVGLVEAFYLAMPETQLAVCKSCHADVAAMLKAGSHRSIAEEQGCRVCHQDAEPLTIPDMLSGSFQVRVSTCSRPCLACHSEIPRKPGLHSSHAFVSQNFGCTVCHDPHDPAIRKPCLGCHERSTMLEAHSFMHQGASPDCTRCHFGPGKPSPYPNIPGHELSGDVNCFSCHDVAVTPPDIVRVDCVSCHR